MISDRSTDADFEKELTRSSASALRKASSVTDSKLNPSFLTQFSVRFRKFAESPPPEVEFDEKSKGQPMEAPTKKRRNMEKVVVSCIFAVVWSEAESFMRMSCGAVQFIAVRCIKLCCCRKPESQKPDVTATDDDGTSNASN